MQELEFALEGISVTGSIVDIETVSLEPVSRGIFTFGYQTDFPKLHSPSPELARTVDRCATKLRESSVKWL